MGDRRSNKGSLNVDEINEALFCKDLDVQSDLDSEVDTDVDMHHSDSFVLDESLSDTESITIQLPDEPIPLKIDQNVYRTTRVQQQAKDDLAPIHGSPATTSRASVSPYHHTSSGMAKPVTLAMDMSTSTTTTDPQHIIYSPDSSSGSSILAPSPDADHSTFHLFTSLAITSIPTSTTPSPGSSGTSIIPTSPNADTSTFHLFTSQEDVASATDLSPVH